MKTLTQFVHKIVQRTRTEEIFVRFARLHPVFRKFIPQPSEYPTNVIRTVRRDNARFRLKLSDYMQWSLFADEPDLAWTLAKQYLSPGAVVLDIGANCGHFSVKLATYCKGHQPDVRVHAFEPNPFVFESLEVNAGLNNLQSHLWLHSLGLGSENEKRFFDYQEQNMGAGRVVPRSASGKLEVTIRRLDDVVDTLNLKNIVFIKLDVEGFEPDVFEGAWKTLASFRPAVFFEVTQRWYEANGHSVAEVLDRLALLGYRFQYEWNGRLNPYKKEKCKELAQYNLLAIQE